MALKLVQKKTIVAEVTELAQSSVALIALDYRGLSVSELTELRAQARRASVHLRVARNTLIRRALRGSIFECINERLVGPVLLAFSSAELSAGARLVRDFVKKNEKLIVKALSLNGKLFDAAQLDFVAKLPTRDEALARLLSVMKAPITKYVQTMAAPHAKLVRTLAAVRDAKLAQA